MKGCFWCDNEFCRAKKTCLRQKPTPESDEGIPPAQNYPRGWLTTALQTINQEPQIHALCWFLDRDSSGDKRWQLFSLREQSGQMLDAAEEFDALLGKQ